MGEGWSGDHLPDRSRLGVGPNYIRPHFISHQELRHPGRPGESVGTVKDGDISESVLERHSDRKAGKKHNQQSSLYENVRQNQRKCQSLQIRSDLLYIV